MLRNSPRKDYAETFLEEGAVDRVHDKVWRRIEPVQDTAHCALFTVFLCHDIFPLDLAWLLNCLTGHIAMPEYIIFISIDRRETSTRSGTYLCYNTGHIPDRAPICAALLVLVWFGA